MTVAIATGSAVGLKGTVVSEITGVRTDSASVRLGHASGVMDVTVVSDGKTIERAGVVRTARRIMDGFVYIRS